MNFLKETYLLELDSPDSELVDFNQKDCSNGSSVYELNIDGKSFLPSKILLDNETDFEEAFIDWKQRKYDTLISKADEILELYDNKNRFKQLKLIYERGSVIPFIGAGLSIPSEYPSWTELLYDIQENTNITKTELDILLSKGQYEEAAEILLLDMGAPAFNELLQNTYGIDLPIKGAIQYLPYLFDKAVITTNYETILKRVYDNANKSFEEQLCGSDADEFSISLGAGKRTLLKLHGDFAREKSRILTLTEYNKHYGDNKVLGRLIADTFFNRTMLFIGASLNKDRTISEMTKYVKEKGYNRCVKHYCFLEAPDKKKRLLIRNRLADCNIFPIWYQQGEHDISIEALFIKLKGELE